MYWPKIPDFGIQRFEVFPSKSGWAELRYWGGTAKDGRVFQAHAVVVQRTDENFVVTQKEVHVEGKQWSDLAAYAHGVAETKLSDYSALVEKAASR